MTIYARCVPFVLTAVLFCLASSQALADQPVDEIEATDDIDREDVKRAQEAFNRGASLYYEGSFGEAIVEFRRAQERYPHPIFAHNIARANEQLERYDRALSAAKEARELQEQASRAQDQMPDAADARNSGLIASLETRLNSQAVAEAVEAHQQQIDGVDAPDAPDTSSGWGLMGWSGVALATVGAGALTGAMVMDRQVASDIEALESNTDISEADFNSEIDSLQGQQTAGRVFLFSGAGMLAIGATLVVLEMTSGSDEEGFAVAPSVSRPGVEMTLRW